ncbi:MAG: hypothetical protein QXT25_04045 [Candidatus Anstonellaceae archaeon]
MQQRQMAKVAIQKSRQGKKEFQKLLDQDNAPIKKVKKRKAKVIDWGDPIKVTLHPPLRDPQKIIVEGKVLVRTCTWGNSASESLVRKNLGRLVQETLRVARRAIQEQDQQNSLLELCLDPVYGINRAGFVGLSGRKLKADGKAVYGMIKQFFKDELFIERLISTIGKGNAK